MDKLTHVSLIKKRFNHRWLVFVVILGLISTAAGFFVHALTDPFSQSEFAEIKDTWTYYSLDDPATTFKSRYVKRMASISENEVMVMERIMVRKVTHPVLMVKGNHQWMRVTLGDEELYRYTINETAPINGENPGMQLTEIPLPQDYIGKELRIEVSSPYQSYAGFPVRAFIGTSNSVMAYVLSSATPQLLVCILCGLISLTLLVIIAGKLRKNQTLDWEALFLACFAICIAIEAVAGDLAAGLLFSPLVNSTLANFTGILTPMFLICYYCLKMQWLRPYYRYWVIFHVTFGLAIFLFAVVSRYDLPEVRNYIDTLNVFGTLATAVAAIGEAHSKNRFYLICTPWIVLVALAHCFLYITSITGSNYSMINASGLLFAMLLLLFYSYTIVEQLVISERAKRQMNVLELKTALLEENRLRLMDHMDENESLRREFKQNLLIVKDLSQDGNYPGVLEYLDILLKDAEAFAKVNRFCEHSLTNLILGRYHRIAEKRHIAATFQIKLPSELAITDGDLLQLLGHLLDHAFRETYLIADPRKRKIHLEIEGDHGSGISIRCQHSIDANSNIFEQGISSADFTKQEVFDLMMVEGIAKKHAGFMKKHIHEDLETIDLQLCH